MADFTKHPVTYANYAAIAAVVLTSRLEWFPPRLDQLAVYGSVNSTRAWVLILALASLFVTFFAAQKLKKSLLMANIAIAGLEVILVIGAYQSSSMRMSYTFAVLSVLAALGATIAAFVTYKPTT
jgi:hypothetical protein